MCGGTFQGLATPVQGVVPSSVEEGEWETKMLLEHACRAWAETPSVCVRARSARLTEARHRELEERWEPHLREFLKVIFGAFGGAIVLWWEIPWRRASRNARFA